MIKDDVEFDFRQDSKCGDPDTDSLKLYKTHKLLWRKKLPVGKMFDLEIIGHSFGRLLLKNNVCMNLSSDRMFPHFDGTYKNRFHGWLSDVEREEFKHKVRTIGGHIIFPAHKKNDFTINQARGVNKKICDRFDLTLECIRGFYKGEKSPLYDTFNRYKDFFDFFFLQDFIDDEAKIKFSFPFDNFFRPPLPQTIEEYKQYKKHTMELINNRNRRILESG